jgi:outer membrane murein-binding lipoprotein Lpp
LLTQVIVAQIDLEATWEFKEAFLQRDYSRELGTCFDGAVRLYHSRISDKQNPREHYLWLPYRLQQWGSTATTRLAGEVAQRATWRVLPPRFFSLLEDIDRARTRESAESALQQHVADVPDLSSKVESLVSLNQELKKQLQAAQENHTELEEEAHRYEKEIDEIHTLLEIAEQERDEAITGQWTSCSPGTTERT